MSKTHFTRAARAKDILWHNKRIYKIRLGSKVGDKGMRCLLTDTQDGLDFTAELYQYCRNIALKSAYAYDPDDLTQEFWIKSLEALNKYDPTQGASFKTFLYLCLTNHIADISRCRKHWSRAGKYDIGPAATQEEI